MECKLSQTGFKVSFLFFILYISATGIKFYQNKEKNTKFDEKSNKEEKKTNKRKNNYPQISFQSDLITNKGTPLNSLVTEAQSEAKKNALSQTRNLTKLLNPIFKDPGISL